MHNQEVDLLKEEIEMLSKQMRQQCHLIKELKYMLAKVSEQSQEYTGSVKRVCVDDLFSKAPPDATHVCLHNFIGEMK